MAFMSKSEGRHLSAMSHFLRQMALLTASGVPVARALEVLDTDNDYPVVEKVAKAVRSSDAGAAEPVFGRVHYAEFLRKIIHGWPEDAQRREEIAAMVGTIAEEYRKMDAFRRQVAAALRYPSIVLVVALFVYTIISMFVVPVLQEVSVAMKVPQPMVTSFFIGNSGVANILVAMACLAMVSVWLMFRFFRRPLEWLIASTPFVRGSACMIHAVRFSRYYSVMLSLDTPADKAYSDAAEMLDHGYFTPRLQALATGMTSTASIVDALKDSTMFSPMAIRMLKAGEGEGNIVKTLQNVASYYEERFETDVARGVKGLEVLVSLVVILLVAALVIGFYFSVFQLASVVG